MNCSKQTVNIQEDHLIIKNSKGKNEKTTQSNSGIVNSNSNLSTIPNELTQSTHSHHQMRPSIKKILNKQYKNHDTAVILPNVKPRKSNGQNILTEQLPSNRIFTEEDIKKAPLLELTNKYNSTQTNNKDNSIFARDNNLNDNTNSVADVIIQVNGLFNNKERTQRDGVVFFGIKDNDKPVTNENANDNINTNNNILSSRNKNPIDVILNITSNDEPNTNTISFVNNVPYMFIIFYIKETLSYYMKFYKGNHEINKYMFVKLSERTPLIIKYSEVIRIGSLLINITPNSKEKELIDINIIDEQTNKNIIKSYKGNDCEKVTIGRSRKCDLCFSEMKGISKLQCTLQYDSSNKEWIMLDGNNGKKSTNGTWVFGLNTYIIYDCMVVEIFGKQFEIKVIQNKVKSS